MAELTGRELDAEVAEVVMGLPVVWSSPPYAPTPAGMEGRCPYLKGRVGGVEYDWATVPRYSTCSAAARQVEDEIERRGLQTDYLLHLCSELRTSPPACLEVPGVWLLFRATPEERCRAAVRVVHAKKPPAP